MKNKMIWKWVNFKARMKMRAKSLRFRLKTSLRSKKRDFFKKLGYISSVDHEVIVSDLRRQFRNEISQAENKKIDRLVGAIKTVNMVKMELETPILAWETTEDVDKPLAYRKIDPPKPAWYAIQVSIDMSRMQRIYQELTLQANSYEYHYLVQSLLEDIRRNVDALIKMEFRL